MKRNITRILVILAIILNISFLCSCVPSVTKVRTKMNKANYNGERIYYDDLMTFLCSSKSLTIKLTAFCAPVKKSSASVFD